MCCKECEFRIRFFNGPHTGRAKMILRVMLLEKGIFSPEIFLRKMVQEGWHWEWDYSCVSKNDLLPLFKADVRCRAELAEKEGRPICIDDSSFRTAAEVGAALSTTEAMVAIGRDDESGFYLTTKGGEKI